MENVMEVQQLEEKKNSRRSALLMGGAALAGLALSRNAKAQTTTPAISDTDILNFALNLEYLEAQFYSLAVTGKPLDATVTVSGDGKTTGGTVTTKNNATTTTNPPDITPVDFSGNVLLKAYATETATEELNHVKFLRTALATSAVAMPNIDLYNSFNALAVAAGLGASFDPFADINSFLLGAFIFEDVGVTAYQGAAPSISSSAYLDKALGIHAVEAYHAGAIRTQIFAAGATVQSSSQMIAHERAVLDGSSTTMDDDIGVTTTTNAYGTASTIADVNANGLTNARTPTQVLNIVYASPGATPAPGGFFPMGLNGNIK